MAEFFKNIEKGVVFDANKILAYDSGSVLSKTVAQTGNVSVTFFAFDEGEGLDAHTAPGDAMVVVTDGEVLVTIDDVAHVVKAGMSIVMPANVPHALKAIQKFKMMLVIIK